MISINLDNPHLTNDEKIALQELLNQQNPHITDNLGMFIKPTLKRK